MKTYLVTMSMMSDFEPKDLEQEIKDKLSQFGYVAVGDIEIKNGKVILKEDSHEN